MNKLWKTILCLIFPNVSYDSDNIYEYVSKDFYNSAYDKLKKLDIDQRKWINMLYVAFPYEGTISRIIEKGKRNFEWSVFDELSTELYKKINNSNYFIPPPDLIVPVPTDSRRKNIRGFDHTEIIAKNLVKCCNNDDWPAVYSQFIHKIRYTKPQGGLGREDRLTNQKNAFELTNDPDQLQLLVKSEIIWLVDDVSTTGTTIGECAKVLKQYAPHLEIIGVVIGGN